jgi:hypothetical protein
MAVGIMNQQCVHSNTYEKETHSDHIVYGYHNNFWVERERLSSRSTTDPQRHFSGSFSPTGRWAGSVLEGAGERVPRRGGSAAVRAGRRRPESQGRTRPGAAGVVRISSLSLSPSLLNWMMRGIRRMVSSCGAPF